MKFNYDVKIDNASVTYQIGHESVTLLYPYIKKIHIEDNSPNWFSIVVSYLDEEIVLYRVEEFQEAVSLKDDLVKSLNDFLKHN